jgi:hypothetical protein
MQPLVDKIALHHYITRSFEDFVYTKQVRGGGMGMVRNMAEFEKYDIMSKDNCTDAVERAASDGKSSTDRNGKVVQVFG